MSFFEAFLISLLVIGPEVFKVQSQNFIQAGQPTATVMEGTDFTFEWNFSLQPGDRNKLKEIIFGTWSTGFIDSYFVTVKSNSEVIENPELIKKHPEYVGRVQWVGDVSKSYAAFRLVNVRLEDTNTYGCEINLGFFANTLESRIILTVERASNTSVFIQVPPSQINVVTGHTAEFKWKYRVSSIDRKLPSTLQWGKYENINFKALCTVSSNGVTTKDPGYLSRILANKTESFGATTYLLSLFRVTVLDEGKYGLMVVHGNRKILEHQVFLEVHEKPQIIASPSVNGPYIMGESLVLFCKTKGKPSPTVKWIKDGRPIKTERDKTDSVYYVMRLTKSDGGYYSCFASNHVGNVSSPRVHVRVQYAPSIIFPKETKTILSWKEHPTRLECIADADPPAQYSWQRADGKIFDRDIRAPANSSVLVVTPSSDSDFSNYTCTAKNKVGEDKAIFTLKPIGPPNPPIITRIEANRNALKVTWQEPSSKQDTPITGHVLKIKKKGEQAVKWKEIAFKAKSNYFILRNLTRATYYSIRLFATNVVGYSNSSTKKEVKTLWEGPPSSPKLRFKETITDTSQFHLTWDVPDNDGGAAVHLFTVWYQVVSSNRTSKDRWNTINVRATAYLLKLNWSSVYSITVTAWNKYGQSFFDPDNAARVTVLEEKPVISNNTHLKNKSGDLKVGAVHSPKEAAKKDMILYLPVLSVLAIPLVVVLLVWRSKIRKKFLENGKYDTCPRVPVGPNIPSSNNCAGRNYANAEENCENDGDLGFERIPDPQIRSWEFSRANLAIERVIGDGAFGVVSKAYALDLPNMKGWNTVAVKSLRESATEIEKRDLLSELSLLKKLKPHPHIIKLLGCITTSDSPIVIIEYVPYGDLLGYLRRSRGLHDHYYDDPDIKPLTNLTSQQMLRFAWQIADGMRYISSKKIIHRDLAARNVLVGENQRCKITDFGMARDVRLETIYVPRSEGRIPVKWTAIEAMTGAMNYSTKSDVWSFGVVLFEICTIGAEPYPGISPLKIPDVVRKGYRNPKPAYVKDELYAIMMNCWKEEPEERPTFESLCDVIRSLETRGGQNYVNVKDCLEAHENNIMESNA